MLTIGLHKHLKWDSHINKIASKILIKPHIMVASLTVKLKVLKIDSMLKAFTINVIDK